MYPGRQGSGFHWSFWPAGRMPCFILGTLPGGTLSSQGQPMLGSAVVGPLVPTTPPMYSFPVACSEPTRPRSTPANDSLYYKTSSHWAISTRHAPPPTWQPILRYSRTQQLFLSPSALPPIGRLTIMAASCPKCQDAPTVRNNSAHLWLKCISWWLIGSTNLHHLNPQMVALRLCHPPRELPPVVNISAWWIETSTVHKVCCRT